MAATDIFISYKREERELAQQVERALIDAGFVTVTDRNIAKNVEFGSAIDRMIRTARLTLVLWTQASATSEWVCQEARLARDLEQDGRPNKYLGVLLENVSLDIEVDLRGKQMLDLSQTGLTDQAITEILDAVKTLLGTPTQANLAHSKSSSSDKSDELQFYTLAHSMNIASGYEKYLDLYPNGDYAEDARRGLARAKKWYLHPFRRGNLSNTIAALAVIAMVGTGIYTANQPPQIITGISPTKYDSLAATLQKERAAHSAQIAAKETAVAKAQDALTAAKRQLQTAQSTLTTKDQKIAELGQIIATKEQALKTARAGLAAAKTAAPQTTPTAPKPDCKTDAGKNGFTILSKCYAADITKLDLSGTDISDLTPIGGLKNLKTLFVYNTKIPDLTPISGLTNLTWLSVDNTKISDLTPISGLKNLTTLSVSYTKIPDLTLISGLTNLTRLSVTSTQISDLTPISGLTKLTRLFTPDGKSHDGRAAVKAAIAAMSP